MKTLPNIKYYLGDGIHYWVIKPDKYSGEPLAKLYKDTDKNPIGMLTIGNKTPHEIINFFETIILRKEHP